MHRLRAVLAAGALLLGGWGLAGAAHAQQGVMVGDVVVTPGQAVTLDASTVAPGALWYDWDFGDGTFLLAGPVVTHTYAIEGVYTVRVNAVTADRRDVFASFTVTVDADRFFAFPLTASRIVGYDPVTGRPVYATTVVRVDPVTGQRVLVAGFVSFNPNTGQLEFTPRERNLQPPRTIFDAPVSP